MAFTFYLSLISTVLVCVTANYSDIPSGVITVCHERYFMISVDQSIGTNIRFEAVDKTGIYPITENYAAKCGYSIRSLYLKSNVQLRASYLSCHTDNKDDKVYRFNFNMITQHKGKEVTYALNKTCTPSLPWSLREVTCEVNYMEVSVKSEITCPSGTKKNDWDNLKLAHSPSSADWQVTFQKAGEQLMPVTLNEARRKGYVFDLTGGRLVFRTPYKQPHSFTTVLDGVPVEAVHATLFSRQSWLVLLVDMVAACSVYKATYEDEGYMSWETPDVLYPGLQTTNFSFGLSGKLLQPTVAKKQGYIVERYNSTVEIGIPYDAEGGHRKSVVSGDLYEFFTYDFYMEQISLDEDDIETRLRFHRTMTTPLLLRPLVLKNRTVLEEFNFTVYLGDIPQDVALISIKLNKDDFQVPFRNGNFSLEKVVSSNDTHGYILKVPFDYAAVIQQHSKEETQFKLDINFTLMVMPENQLYKHSISLVAIVPDLSPPMFDAACSENGMSFKLDHKPSNVLWEISVGSNPLTSELAAKQGYIMNNNSQTLQLDVPLLSEGYEKKNLSLQGYLGYFEILVRNRETSEVQASMVKTCPFFTNELIVPFLASTATSNQSLLVTTLTNSCWIWRVCSTDGIMTVVADLSLAVASGGVPAKMTLLNKICGPKEADTTRALFSFHVNRCGSNVKLGKGTVTYENEIVYTRRSPSEAADRVLLQCTYQMSSLHRLFSAMTFESDIPGVGRIIHTSQSATGLQSTTKSPNAQLQPQPQQNLYSSARYIKVSGLNMPPQLHGKGLDGPRVHRAKRMILLK